MKIISYQQTAECNIVGGVVAVTFLFYINARHVVSGFTFLFQFVMFDVGAVAGDDFRDRVGR